ncbi:MAG: Histidine kinase [uncultured Sulfurovum sp.]|uniref:histidine kinase n=1 Tax=uncultured Sulfurovum sp. TaxID=269237 RepID=A0A6S6TXM2_9BACT|nr:MAG: Histidine kinase [uncultured Sulfurovum sp.]
MTLYNKIRIIFLVAVLLLTAFFTAYMYIEKSQKINAMEKRYMQTARIVMKHFREAKRNHNEVDFNEPEFLKIVQNNAFEFVPTLNIESIVKSSEEVLKRSMARTHIKIIRKQSSFYLWVKHRDFELFLKDKSSKKIPFELFVVYFLALSFLVLFYFWLTRSLGSLKVLHKKILSVEKGDLSVSFKSVNQDEIAQVSNAFDDALRKIESLMNSRQLFLRTIMHELKTPIGKGRLLNEFLEDEKKKEQYSMVFERLELLIEEFSKIEKMLSSSYELKLNNYNVQEMIDQALELMIMEEEEIEEKVDIVVVEPLILNTDFELFSLALKNLIDNALKYSNNKKVSIRIYADKIKIENKGKPFMEKLEEFSQPFNSKGNGLGLGLYIVQNIMKMLSLNLNYEYINEKHSFTIFKTNI